MIVGGYSKPSSSSLPEDDDAVVLVRDEEAEVEAEEEGWLWPWPCPSMLRRAASPAITTVGSESITPLLSLSNAESSEAIRFPAAVPAPFLSPREERGPLRFRRFFSSLSLLRRFLSP